MKETENCTLTPAQKQLIALLAHQDVDEFFIALKSVHFVATYEETEAKKIPWHHGHVHKLLDAIDAIRVENLMKETAAA